MTWPASFDASTDLLVAVNNFTTTLVSAIGPSDTSIAVTSVTGLQTVNGVISIDGEVVLYTGINTGGANPVLFGCARGVDGSTAAAHSAGAPVELRWVARHHNTLVAAVMALQAALGVTPASDPVNSQTFASLADRLSNTLPMVLSKAVSSDWTFAHDRKRLLDVSCWRKNGSSYVPVTPNVISQSVNTSGTSVVTIQFSAGYEGYVVAQ